MSMISSQVGELRFMAHMLDTDGHPSFAREVRRAADTIWELRNKLAGVIDQGERIAALEDENARLRSCLSDDAENARQIMGESAKLREQIHWLKKGDVLHVLTDQELADQQRHEREMQASIDALNADNNMLREMLSESRQANEKTFTELKRYKSIFRGKQNFTSAMLDENDRLWQTLSDALARLSAANDEAGGGFIDGRFCERLRKLGIEVKYEDEG